MRRDKLLLLVSSLAMLGLLAWAAFEENVLREWRGIQRRYRAQAPPEIASAFSVQLRQVVVPGLSAADRCVSCHVGMAVGETPLGTEALFRAHPRIPHDPAEFGCTICHGGQGAATESSDAHGEVEFWPEPMIPRRYAYAGCGACHTHLAVSGVAEMERGRSLVERLDCLACHALDGRGGTLRPGGAAGIDGGDLSRIGMRGVPAGWYEKHLDRSAREPHPAWRASFGAAIGPDDRAALGAYLASRTGAPGLVEGKSLFHSLGCRGCHKVNGVGGDDGPDLTREGKRDPGRLDFSRVPEGHDLSAWLAEHFRNPASVVAGSGMPILGLTESQIDGLVYYLHSLRQGALPEAFWSPDRIKALRFGEREFAPDGATIWGTFCAACHGANGEGMRYPGIPSFPNLANPDFLAIASDAFLRGTVHRGRPGRRMPAWGEKEGGLRPAEIDAVVAHIRRLGGGVAAEPDLHPPRWVRGDSAEGASLYRANCASCHGPSGEGAEGPALANPVLLDTATDTYLVETIRRGRRGSSMSGYDAPTTTHRALSGREIESIVAHLRTWEVKR